MLLIGLLTNTILGYSKSTYMEIIKVREAHPNSGLQYTYRIWITMAFAVGMLLVVLFCIAPVVQARLKYDPYGWYVGLLGGFVLSPSAKPSLYRILNFVFTKGGLNRLFVLGHLIGMLSLGLFYAVRHFDASQQRLSHFNRVSMSST